MGVNRTYNKLVRDRIPEIIENNGEKPITKILSDDLYKMELERKLYEEYQEVITSSGNDRIEELADLLEVMISLANVDGKSFNDIENVRKEKYTKRGGFSKKIFLMEVK